MSCFDPSTSLLAGLDPTYLRTRLQQLQQAYLDISSGLKGESYSYTQGDGARTVTYNKANLADLIQAIKTLQAQLGIIDRPRRALGVSF